MESLRWFAPDVEVFSQEWRETVVDSRVWTLVDPDAGFEGPGEAGGFFVNCGSLRGYAKQSGDVCRAASEKIASDLAFDLGLPVPPVILTEPDARRCSVSSIPFLAPWEWKHVKNQPDQVQAMAPRLAKVSSAMLVFDTWVDNGDRCNERNVLLSAAVDDAPGIAYIDYAYSLSMRWNENDAPPVTQQWGPFPVVGGLIDDVVSATIDAIEGLGDDHIQTVVSRVPEEFLPQRRKQVLADGLISRRGALRSFFKPESGGNQ